MANTNNKPTRVVTGDVRLSYEHLFVPYARDQNAESKYSVTVLLPKTDTATIQRIKVAIEAAKQEGLSSKFNGVIPPILPIPIYDGDGVRPSDGQPFGEECRGHLVFTASTKRPPQVVDAQLNPIINQSEVYSGMYARVSVNFFPYNTSKKGIGCGLNNVQKLRDGESLAGSTSAAEDFEPIPSGSPAYAQPAPARAQAPVYNNTPQQYAPAPTVAPPATQDTDPMTGLPVSRPNGGGGIYGL